MPEALPANNDTESHPVVRSGKLRHILFIKKLIADQNLKSLSSSISLSTFFLDCTSRRPLLPDKFEVSFNPLCLPIQVSTMTYVQLEAEVQTSAIDKAL